MITHVYIDEPDVLREIALRGYHFVHDNGNWYRTDLPQMSWGEAPAPFHRYGTKLSLLNREETEKKEAEKFYADVERLYK